MKKLVFSIVLAVFVAACGSGLDKHAAGLILADYLNAKLLMTMDLWNDIFESRGYFILCNQEGKVLLVHASFRHGKVVESPKIKIIEGTSCVVPIKQN